MSNIRQDYIDLLASGDKNKISCVLMAAGASAGLSGLAAGITFAPANAVPVAGTAFNVTAAAIGAVLGALLSAKVAYNFCGGESTRGSFDQLFKTGSIDRGTLENSEALIIREYGVSPGEARLLFKAAYVYASNKPQNVIVDASFVEKKNAVSFLLQKLKAAEIA